MKRHIPSHLEGCSLVGPSNNSTKAQDGDQKAGEIQARVHAPGHAIDFDPQVDEASKTRSKFNTTKLVVAQTKVPKIAPEYMETRPKLADTTKQQLGQFFSEPSMPRSELCIALKGSVRYPHRALWRSSARRRLAIETGDKWVLGCTHECPLGQAGTDENLLGSRFRSQESTSRTM